MTHVISKLTGQAQAIEAAPLAEWQHGHGVMHDLSDGEFIQVKLGAAGLLVHDGKGNHFCIPLAEIISFAQSANAAFKPDPNYRKTGLVRIDPKGNPMTPEKKS